MKKARTNSKRSGAPGQNRLAGEDRRDRQDHGSRRQRGTQPADTSTPQSPEFLPPLRPQRRLLLVLSITFALWMVALAMLYYLTVYARSVGTG